MVTKRVIGNIFKILLNPRLFWQRYTFNNLSFNDFTKKIFLVLMLAFFLVLLLGNAINIWAENGFLLTLISSLNYTILHFLAFFVVTFIEYKYCKMYIKTNYVKVAVFSLAVLMPFYILIALITVLPKIFFMMVFALYGLSVLYFGALYFFNIDKSNILVFTILTSIILTSGLVVAYTLQGIIMDFFTSIIG